MSLTDTAPTGVPTAALARAGRLLAPIGRYGLASAVALCADTAVYFNLAGGPATAAQAGIAGYLIGLLLHYVLSARFVFPDPNGERNEARTFVGFAATGALGLAVTATAITVLTATFHLAPMAAKGIAVPLAFGAIYGLRRMFVFGPRPVRRAFPSRDRSVSSERSRQRSS